MEELKLLLWAVRRAVLGEQLVHPAVSANWAGVCSLSKAHDLSLIVFEGLGDTALPPSVSESFLRHGAAAVGRFYSQNKAVKQLTAALAEAGIDYMPLKGMVLRSLYPNPEWRVGRDVDILVRPADFDGACRVAEAVLSPVKISRGRHDVGFEAAGGVRVELHFSLFNGDEGFGDLLSDPFANAAAEGRAYRLPDAELYAYHIAHMAKHFHHGGCGIRAFLDLFLLRRSLSTAALDEASGLLKGAGLSRFERTVGYQSEVFFGSGTANGDTDRLAAFVAANQAFGSFASSAALRVGRSGKKRGVRRVLSRAFPGYRTMCHIFPVLCKWPILLPFCWIARGLRVFSKKDRARFAAAARAATTVKEDNVAEIIQLYEYLGLEG